jgi:hypothetical protein
MSVETHPHTSLGSAAIAVVEESREAIAEHRTPVPADGGGAMLAMIERAAANPNVDAAKLETLMALKERADALFAKRAFDAAYVEMAGEVPSINQKGHIIVFSKADREAGRTDGRPQQDTPFATLADINDVVKPILAKHGFAIWHKIGNSSDGRVTVTGALSHRDGHREETTFTGAYNIQASGSTITYGRRYTTLALLNITSRAPMDMKTDDDGKAAGAGDLVTEDQAASLRKALADTAGDEAKFLAYIKVETIEDIRAAKFDAAMKVITDTAAKRREQA